MVLFSNKFKNAFIEILKRSGITCYKISKYSHIDESYLSRLLKGQRTNPSAETVVKIALATVHFNNQITIYDIDELFKAIGHSLFPEK